MANFLLNIRVLPTSGNPIPFFFPNSAPSTGSPNKFTFSEQGDSDQPVAKSQLGTNVYSNLVFNSGSYIRDGKTTAFNGIQLDTVIINVAQTKNIISTATQGRNGTVKEYISDGDYVIQVSGVLTSLVPNQYPAESVRLLTELFKVPEALEFTSEFLDRLGSFNGVITNYTIAQSEGSRNIQPFSFTMLSDSPIELQLNEEEQILNGN